MSNRPLDIIAFLDQHHWGTAEAWAFDGDFSARRYARLTQPDGTTAILMDADADQKTASFVALADVLRGNGVAAPQIYAANAARGLVLLQDFGTRNLGALLDAGQSGEGYFLQAAEILAGLHRRFDREAIDIALPFYDGELFTAQAELFLDGYIPFAEQREASEEERQDFRAAWRAVLRPLEKLPKSLLLRDFMPDNLMVLPNNSLGVLDFQDAGVGCIAYDLASLCEEVRRDGGFALLPKVVAHYLACSEIAMTTSDLLRACTILSAQRHLRILGIIAGVAVKQGKRDKLAFLPRIRRHLAGLAQQPCLVPVREWLQKDAVNKM